MDSREQYPLCSEMLYTAEQPPRAAARRRAHFTLRMDTCGDTLPPGTPGLPQRLRERPQRHLTPGSGRDRMLPS